MTVYKRTINSKSDTLEVVHHMDSPNMARIQNDPSMKTHENRGYFELYVTDNKNKRRYLDRHSRKADLVKLKSLLEKY